MIQFRAEGVETQTKIVLTIRYVHTLHYLYAYHAIFVVLLANTYLTSI